MKVVRVSRYYYVDESALDEVYVDHPDERGNEALAKKYVEDIAMDWFREDFGNGEIDTDSFTVEFVKDEH